jgi:hypothetical protein
MPNHARRSGHLQQQHHSDPWYPTQNPGSGHAALQSDYSAKFKALGLQHHLLAGADYASEKRQVYGARTAAQGGVTLTKPNTTAGTPDDGASINESFNVC